MVAFGSGVRQWNLEVVWDNWSSGHLVVKLVAVADLLGILVHLCWET